MGFFLVPKESFHRGLMKISSREGSKQYGKAVSAEVGLPQKKMASQSALSTGDERKRDQYQTISRLY